VKLDCRIVKDSVECMARANLGFC